MRCRRWTYGINNTITNQFSIVRTKSGMKQEWMLFFYNFFFSLWPLSWMERLCVLCRYGMCVFRMLRSTAGRTLYRNRIEKQALYTICISLSFLLLSSISCREISIWKDVVYILDSFLCKQALLSIQRMDQSIIFSKILDATRNQARRRRPHKCILHELAFCFFSATDKFRLVSILLQSSNIIIIYHASRAAMLIHPSLRVQREALAFYDVRNSSIWMPLTLSA